MRRIKITDARQVFCHECERAVKNACRFESVTICDECLTKALAAEDTSDDEIDT